MRVTAIIPTFNRPVETHAAIRSVLAQGAAAPEAILVVDDASAVPFRYADGPTGDVPLRIIRHEQNRGAAAARNTAIALVETPWIAFLDSDDLWLPGKMEAQRAHLAAITAPATLAVTCGFRKTRSGRDEQDFWPISSASPADFASGCWFCPGSTALVAREAFERIGPFDERLPRFEDNDWYLRFALQGGRVERADLIGSLIQIGRHPTPRKVADSLRIFEEIWHERDEMAGRGTPLGRYRRAWAALEQAAAIYRSDEVQPFAKALRMLPYLARSWLEIPRFRIHLNRFWGPPPATPPASGG